MRASGFSNSSMKSDIPANYPDENIRPKQDDGEAESHSPQATILKSDMNPFVWSSSGPSNYERF